MCAWIRRVLIVFVVVCCGSAVSPARQAIVSTGQVSVSPRLPQPQPHNWQRQSGIQSHFHSAEWMSVFRGMHRWQRLYSIGNSPENSPNSPQNHIHINYVQELFFLWGSCVSATGRMRHELKYADEFFFLFSSFSLFFTRSTWSTKRDVFNIFCNPLDKKQWEFSFFHHEMERNIYI